MEEKRQELAARNAKATPWPNFEEYALAHPCSSCGAMPGELCHDLRKRGFMHLARQAAGAKHYARDVSNVPWPKNSVYGKRYDTLSRD